MLPKEISKKKEVGVGRIDEEGSEGSPHFWAIREGSIALKKVGWEEPQQMSQNFAGLVLYRGLGLVETERERGGMKEAESALRGIISVKRRSRIDELAVGEMVASRARRRV